MGIGFLFWCRGLFFARKREKKREVFFRVFGGDFAFLGVISRFGGCFCAMRPLFRAQRDFLCVAFPPAGP